MALDPLLLKTLAGASSSSETSLQEVLLSQLEAKDPTMAMLAKYLTTSSDDDVFEDDEDELGHNENYDPTEVEAAFEQQAKHSELLEDRLSQVTDIACKMRKKLDAANRELKELQHRNDTLAEALGACYLCWGEDYDCEVCSGHGRPGAYRPIAEKYERYIAPVNQHLQQQSVRRKSADRGPPNLHL